MVFFLQSALLSLITLASADEKEHSYRLVACMQLTRHQLVNHKDELDMLVSSSTFDREKVLTKFMGQMIVQCMSRISMEVSQEVLYEKGEDGAITQRHAGYAAIPDSPITTEEDLMLTPEEEDTLAEIMEKTKKAEEMRAKGGQPSGDYESSQTSQPIGTSLGLIYILAVFLIFAGIVIYGIKRLNDRESSKKGRKRKNE